MKDLLNKNFIHNKTSKKVIFSIYKKYFLYAQRFIENRTSSGDMKTFLTSWEGDKKQIHDSAIILKKHPSILSPQKWTKEQRAFIEKNIFTTFDQNNYLHQFYIASAPTPYLLDVEEDNMIEFDPPPHAHIVIRVRNKQSCTIIERSIKQSHSLSGIEIFLHRGGVNYIYIQPQTIQNQIMLRHADVSEQSALNWHMHILGGHNTYNEVYTKNNGCASNLYGTYIAPQHAHLYMDYSTIHKKIPGGASNMIVHGIGLNHSYSNFHGNISIHQKAIKTAAHLEEKCLLFSQSAKHDTMPTLQIETNDVVASHSASITQVDENYLFYMKTRGINEEKAKKMILRGFLEEVYQYISLPGEKENITHYIHNLNIHV